MSERRAVERQSLSTSWRTSFDYGGKEREAVMMDLSPRGAGLLLYQAEPFGLTAGDQLTLRTVTPLGESVCVARVMWVDFVTAGLRFGVEFQQIAPSDPLLAYADSPF